MMTKHDPIQDVHDIVHAVTGAGEKAREFLQKHPLGHDCPVCRKLKEPHPPTVHDLLVAIRVLGWSFSAIEGDMPPTQAQERILRKVMGKAVKR